MSFFSVKSRVCGDFRKSFFHIKIKDIHLRFRGYEPTNKKNWWFGKEKSIETASTEILELHGI